MAQHLLDGFQIRAVFQQMRRERMPQRMRRDIRLDARLALVVLDVFPKPLLRQPHAVAIHKQCRFLRILLHLPPCLFYVVLQRVFCNVPHRYNPLFFIADAPYKPHIDIDVGNIQADQLRHADTCGIQ